MRLFVCTVAFVLLSACSLKTPETLDDPEQVVAVFFEAYENADGHTLVDCMSADAMADINLYMEQLRETPEESSVYLNSIGINLSAEEVTSITAGDFITALFNSEAYSEQLPDFSDTEFGHALVYGDKAIVPVTTNGDTRDMELVFEDQSWKIAASGMDII
ncbi:MAG: hypothetical protein J7K88_00645 [Candidatus Fermentibacteraceae bacterium]|nr:hypothetical protein [Candidatus Fermentibacteraceae bacterium]